MSLSPLGLEPSSDYFTASVCQLLAFLAHGHACFLDYHEATLPSAFSLISPAWVNSIGCRNSTRGESLAFNISIDTSQLPCGIWNDRCPRASWSCRLLTQEPVWLARLSARPQGTDAGGTVISFALFWEAVKWMTKPSAPHWRKLISLPPAWGCLLAPCAAGWHSDIDT